MEYVYIYQSPIGEIKLISNGEYLTKLEFIENGYNINQRLDDNKNIFDDTINWLNRYFLGENPNFMPKIKLNGSKFQLMVWEILENIPYGLTTSYGKIAKNLMIMTNKSVSAQAVGRAISQNPICIIIPCHRVISSDGKLKGYSGGIYRKQYLLGLEKFNKYYN